MANYLRLFRGNLYKKYPSLWHRQVTRDERERLIELGYATHALAANCTLLRAVEMDAILSGHDSQFRSLTISDTTLKYVAITVNFLTTCNFLRIAV